MSERASDDVAMRLRLVARFAREADPPREHMAELCDEAADEFDRLQARLEAAEAAATEHARVVNDTVKDALHEELEKAEAERDAALRAAENCFQRLATDRIVAERLAEAAAVVLRRFAGRNDLDWYEVLYRAVEKYNHRKAA